jgi:O-antigen/teichoic acid export membrane protein
MNSSQQIKLGAVLSYLALGINVLSGLIYTPWMISSIGQGEFGLFTLAMSVINLFVFDFGLSVAATRFVSKYLAEGKEDMANKCLGLFYKLYFYIDIVLIIVLTSIYFFIPQIYRELTPSEMEDFKVVYAVAAIYSVIQFPFLPINGILTAYEKFVQIKVCDVLQKVIVVGSMTFCLLIGWGLYALVCVNAVSGVLTIIMKIWCIKHYTNSNLTFGYHDRNLFYSIISFSGWTTIVSLCQRLIFTIVPTILGMISGSVAIAVFGVASAIEGYVFNFAYALNGMFLPRVSQILAKGCDVMPLMIKVGRIQMMIVGAITMGFFCIGSHFIRIWVGPNFEESYICTIFLILPTLLFLPQDIGLQIIIVKNEVKFQAIVWSLMAVINVILSYILGISSGAIGVSLSIFIAYTIRTIGLDVILKKRLHLELFIFFKEVFMKVGWVIIPVTLLSIFINNYIPSMGIVAFLIKALIFSSLYMFGIILVSNKEEKELFKQPIKAVITKFKNKF